MLNVTGVAQFITCVSQNVCWQFCKRSIPFHSAVKRNESCAYIVAMKTRCFLQWRCVINSGAVLSLLQGRWLPVTLGAGHFFIQIYLLPSCLGDLFFHLLHNPRHGERERVCVRVCDHNQSLSNWPGMGEMTKIGNSGKVTLGKLTVCWENRERERGGGGGVEAVQWSNKQKWLQWHQEGEE